jgi:thiamine biosynthesis lipoprotein
LVLIAASCGGLSPAEGPSDPPIAPASEPLPAVAAPESTAGGDVLVFAGRGMGVPVRLAVVGGRWEQLNPAQLAALVELSRLEDIVNPWDGGSELSRWNDGPPAGGRVSAELAELVGMALELCGETGGAFDPTVGALLASRGHYGEPLPLAADPRELLGCDRVRLVETADGPFLERLHPGVRLDLSGLAKGWAADRLKAQLVAAGVTNACLDLGSSTIVAWGPGPAGRGWAVRDPLEGAVESAGSHADFHWLVDEALALSGRTPEALDPAELTGVHLVDPSAARFVEEAPIFASARGTDAAACDAWATAALVSVERPGEHSGVVVSVYTLQSANSPQ